MRLLKILLFAVSLAAQTHETVTVQSQTLSRKTRLPGELYPFLKVPVQARITGFIESMDVDRGSQVKKGQTIARLSAPELAAQIAEAEAKVQAIESQRAEAEAKRIAAQSTHDRLKAASATPGVVAENEVILAAQAVDAAKGSIAALLSAATTARASVKPLRELESYLEVTAPFDGIVTERLVHPGALTGPGAGPLVILEQHTRLRLVVAVPEADAAGIARGAQIAFKVPAHQGQTFSGTVARNGNAMDSKTRTMPVELDVSNPKLALAPGMYAEVDWPVRRMRASLMVPPTAIASNTERAFVIRVTNGRAEWVNVSRGVAQGDLVEAMGALQAGDVIIRRATDEIRDGSVVQTKPAGK